MSNRPFSFGEFPVLETERLILREITLTDAESIFDIRGDYEVTKYNGGAAYSDIIQAVELIEAMASSYRAKEEIRWGITLKAGSGHSNGVIGMCGYNYWKRHDFRGSIGYDLARACWGRGIMPEALRVMVEFGFERMALNRIEADASIYNSASVRVLRKLGFQQEGVQREQYFEDGRFHDLLLYALLKSEYKKT